LTTSAEEPRETNKTRNAVGQAIGMGATRYFEAEAVVKATEEPHIRAQTANMAAGARWGASQAVRPYLLAASLGGAPGGLW